MTMKIPVVLSDDSNTHSPLKRGNKLPTNTTPVSTEKGNTLTTKPDGLFTPKKTGLFAIKHDYTLSGDGTDNNPLSVRVSNLRENIIQIRQQADNSGGLYLPGNTFLPSVAHNNSLNGSGKSDNKLCVRISNKTGNSLQLIDHPVTGGGGLYAAQKETIKYADITGPILCEGPDNPGAEVACGKFGGGVYWKQKITLSKAMDGDNDFLVYPELLSIPCKSDGTPVPYHMLVNYPLVQAGQTPCIYLYLICSEIPTHTINRRTLYKSEIRRGVAVTTPTGLDDIYDTANPGSGPYYMLHYMFSS